MGRQPLCSHPTMAWLTGVRLLLFVSSLSIYHLELYLFLPIFFLSLWAIFLFQYVLNSFIFFLSFSLSVRVSIFLLVLICFVPPSFISVWASLFVQLFHLSISLGIFMFVSFFLSFLLKLIYPIRYMLFLMSLCLKLCDVIIHATLSVKNFLTWRFRSFKNKISVSASETLQ